MNDEPKTQASSPNPSPGDTAAGSSPPPAAPRRDFLASVLVAGTAVPAALGGAAMGLRYVLPPSKKAQADLLMCRAEEVAPGESRIFENVLGNRICLLRDSEVAPPGESTATYRPFKAFSLRCSHLGCFAHWEGGVRKFVCPCHNAVFNEDGEVVAGPPPVGLTRIAVEVRDGLVYMRIPYVKA